MLSRINHCIFKQQPFISEASEKGWTKKQPFKKRLDQKYV